MITPKFIATVVNGRLHPRNIVAFNAYIWKFKENEELDVTVKKRERQRSLPQNSWYWGGILPVIAHETGHTVEELHEIFKRKFLPRQEIKYRGQSIFIPGSTANLTSEQFSIYIERIRTEAADMGIRIPEAGDYS